MAQKVRDVDVLHEYLRRVMDRARHHAHAVDNVVLTLAGAIVWAKDPDTAIEVRTHSGSTANVLWVQIGGKRFALAYRHEVGTIEIRSGTLRGTVLASFTNDTPPEQVKKVFEGLLA
jgi:hypothetical protein